MPRIAYISFDQVPAPKGAATHIEAFVRVLGQTFGQVTLVTVAPDPDGETVPQRWPGVDHITLPAVGKTLIDRVLDFRRRLWQWLQGQRFDVVQVRSPFEGYPIALHKATFCQHLVFEVNGLPSIELKYRYPQVADDRELQVKLRSQEQFCLAAADWVLTPSPITQDYLIQQYNLPPERVSLVANGVDLTCFPYQPPPSLNPDPFHLLYIGTLAAWQGVGLALEALALYCRDAPAKLTVIGPGKADQIRKLEARALRLGISDRWRVLEPRPQAELIQFMHQAHGILAPLTPNDRNLVQGCCPLKVLEGMACGTPVIASDLPVVRALGQPNFHLLAVRPGSAKAIKDALLRLQTDPGLRRFLSANARRQVEARFTWQRAGKALLDGYGELGVRG